MGMPVRIFLFLFLISISAIFANSILLFSSIEINALIFLLYFLILLRKYSVSSCEEIFLSSSILDNSDIDFKYKFTKLAYSITFGTIINEFSCSGAQFIPLSLTSAETSSLI